MKTRSFAALAVAGSALLVACGGGGDAADTTTTTTTTTTVPETTTTTSTTTTTTSTTTTTTTLPEIIRQPLTGEPVDSEADKIDRAALAVKIDNAPPSRRNHSGLANADIVFEEIVEGSLTRFAAIFHTQDADPVGPIRSGRTQDVDLLSSYNEPLFAWSGGNRGVTRVIRDSFLTDLNVQNSETGGAYYRGPGPRPHNLYSDTQSLWALTPEDHPGPPPQQFEYLRPEESFEGREVAGVDVTMRGIDVEWDWDDDRGVFLRSQEGDLHVDSTYGQIDATNVIVMVVDYRPSFVDARSPEAQTLGAGLVYVFSDGQLVVGKWSRALAVGTLKLTDLDGEPIALTPGNTWIELAERIEDSGPDESPADFVIRYAES